MELTYINRTYINLHNTSIFILQHRLRIYKNAPCIAYDDIHCLNTHTCKDPSWGEADGVGRWHLPAVFAGKYQHGQYSQKWRLPAFINISLISLQIILLTVLATYYIVHGHHSTIFA